MKKIIYILFFLSIVVAQHQLPDGQFKVYSDTIGQNVNDYVYIDNVLGYTTVGFKLTVPTGGQVAFEATFDGITWVRVTLKSIDDDVFMQTTSVSNNYIGSIANSKAFRIITTIAGSADGIVIGTLSRVASVIEGIEFGYPPHKFGYIPVHRDKSYESAVTGDSLWIPNSGKRFVVTDLMIVVGGSTDGVLSIFDGTDSENNRIFKGAIEVATNKQFKFNHPFKTPFVSSTMNNILKVTTTANMTVDINIHGYEIEE